MSQSKDTQKVYSTLQKFWRLLDQKGGTMHEAIKTLTGKADMTKEQSWVWLAEAYDAAYPGSDLTSKITAAKAPRCPSSLSHATDEDRLAALNRLAGTV